MWPRQPTPQLDALARAAQDALARLDHLAGRALEMAWWDGAYRGALVGFIAGVIAGVVLAVHLRRNQS